MSFVNRYEGQKRQVGQIRIRKGSIELGCSSISWAIC